MFSLRKTFCELFQKNNSKILCFVRVPGFEPGTSRVSVERSSQLSYTRTKQVNKYLENITEKLIFNKRKGLVRDDIRICYQPSVPPLQVVILQSWCGTLWGIRPTENPHGPRLPRFLENLGVSFNLRLIAEE